MNVRRTELPNMKIIGCVPQLRYTAHAEKYIHLPHCTESLKHNDIEAFCLTLVDKYYSYHIFYLLG